MAHTPPPRVLMLQEDQAIGGVNVMVGELLDGLRASGWWVAAQPLNQRHPAACWRAARQSDVILATNNFRTAYVAWILGLLLRKPVVVWVHGPLMDVLSEAPPHPLKRARLRWLYRRLRHFVFISRSAQASFDQFLGQPLPANARNVIHNAIRIASLAAPVPATARDDTVELGYVGRLSPEKQPDRLLAMLRRLPANFRLTLVGDGPLRAQLEHESQDLMRAGRLAFRGVKPREQALDADWQLTVLASRYEGGCPLSALESMSAGIPFVAPSLPALRETVAPEAAFLLAPDDSPQALADTVQAVLALPQQQVKAAMTCVLARHRWEDFIQRWQALLRAATRQC